MQIDPYAPLVAPTNIVNPGAPVPGSNTAAWGFATHWSNGTMVQEADELGPDAATVAAQIKEIEDYANAQVTDPADVRTTVARSIALEQ